MVGEGDIIRKTVNAVTWQKCLDWNEALNMGEKPPTREMVTEEMLVDLIIRIVEGEK